jgi:hypothetical protein
MNTFDKDGLLDRVYGWSNYVIDFQGRDLFLYVEKVNEQKFV